jgi:prophage antirepressor-like protein
MNALIDLNNCREYMTINIGGKDHKVKLGGTINDPYFCGKDVCDILGYKDSKDAIKKFTEEEDRSNFSEIVDKNNLTVGGAICPPHGEVQIGHKIFSFREGQLLYLNETGLYSLILSSKAPFAKEFKRLVCKTILPSIRKYGSYQVESQLADAVARLSIKDSKIKEVEEKVKQAEKQAMVELEARRKAELKAQRINKFMRRSTIKERKLEWIYIATTKKYAKERIFKPGSTDRISKRICGYTTGHPKKDSYFYVWIKKCYNAKDLDNHIQKMLHMFKYKEKFNDTGRHELIHGIKLSDLIAIIDFIVDNYDASIDFVNNFITTRLDESLDEEDPEPVPLDIKKLTYHIGDHTETIDLEEEESESIRDAFDDILLTLKEQRDRNTDEPVVVQRKDLMSRLSNTTHGNKKDLWNQIKIFTGWTSSKVEIDDGQFKYKIVY